MTVLVIGDLAVVVSADVPHLPQAGDNVPLKHPGVHVSGVGSNLAWYLRQLDVDVEVAGAVGHDPLGDYVLRDLEGCGIGTDRVERLAAVTSLFLILVDGTGERTMVGTRGASELVPLGIHLLTDPEPAWVHISGYLLLAEAARRSFDPFVAALNQRGIPWSIDLEGVCQTHYRPDLSGGVALCNRAEYAEYFGSVPVEGAAVPRPLVVKSDSDGAFLMDPEEGGHALAYAAEVRDLTGAGDAFNAGFITARLAGCDPLTACRWGNASAYFKVAQTGPRVALDPAAVRHIVEVHP